jgi:tetratricopeptide (TPR) repeat protein
MLSQFEIAETFYELGALYTDKGELKKAEPRFRQAADVFLKLNSFREYLKCQNKLFRVLVEMGRTQEVEILNSQLTYQTEQHDIQPSAALLYTQALFYFFNKKYEDCEKSLDDSLRLALQDDVKEDICNALFGQARLYFVLGRQEQAEKKIKNLEIFFDVIKLPDIQVATQFLITEIEMKRAQYNKALDLIWKCHDILKSNPNPFFRCYLFVNFSLCYFHLGNFELAKHHLKLARQAIKDDEHINSLRMLQRAESIIGGNEPEYDLVLDKSSSMVKEKQLGEIQVKNQFILLEMLNLFVTKQGQTFSKEDLARMIWDQDYDPGVHDNKIYVTIKRLRQLIEPQIDQPKYIFRSRNGYYLDKSAKVCVL